MVIPVSATCSLNFIRNCSSVGFRMFVCHTTVVSKRGLDLGLLGTNTSGLLVRLYRNVDYENQTIK